MSWADNRGNSMNVDLGTSGATVHLCEHSKADPTECVLRVDRYKHLYWII